MKCSKCNGTGIRRLALVVDISPPHDICKRCNGKGTIKLTLSERVKSIKYGHIIKPVRDLAIENSGLKNTLRAIIKTLSKTRYKKNKQARLIVKQGKYIQCLKTRIRQYEEPTMSKV